MYESHQELIRRQNKPEKNYIELTPGMPVRVQHRQNTSWEPATVMSQCTSNSYWIMQENGTDQPKVYRRTRTMLKIRCTDFRQTRHNNSQSTESEKAEFHTPVIPNVTRNCVKHNSAENISQDLVHLKNWTLKLLLLLILNQKKGRNHRNCRCTCTCTCTGEDQGTKYSHFRIQEVNEKELWKVGQFI